jgi:hypothetical protein
MLPLRAIDDEPGKYRLLRRLAAGGMAEMAS